jgi:heterodisulfide reductase subunit A
MAQERRIGVFVCYCGGNISDSVDVEKVREEVAREPGVVIARTHMFTCSDAAQQEMIDHIKTAGLDGLVVASCAPSLHLHTFRGMAERAGLNRYQYVQVNLREQCSWAHTDDKKGATEKAIHLVRAGIANAL